MKSLSTLFFIIVLEVALLGTLIQPLTFFLFLTLMVEVPSMLETLLFLVLGVFPVLVLVLEVALDELLLEELLSLSLEESLVDE
jgi:hypothetical protein